MNSVVEAVSRRVSGGDPKEVPQWSMPMVIDITRCPLIGEHAGHNWYDWPELRLEVEEVGEPIGMNDRAIPDGPMYRVPQDGGGYTLQVLRAHVRGTYLQRTTVVERPLPTPAAPAPVDVLDGVSLLTGYGGNGRYAFRGPEQIIARFKAHGIEFRSVGDGADVLVTASGGGLTTKYREEVALVSPLLVPYILNGAVHCEVTQHRQPVDAVTLAFAIPDPIPWCQECMPK